MVQLKFIEWYNDVNVSEICFTGSQGNDRRWERVSGQFWYTPKGSYIQEQGVKD